MTSEPPSAPDAEDRPDLAETNPEAAEANAEADTETDTEAEADPANAYARAALYVLGVEQPSMIN